METALDVVREAYDAFGRGDIAALTALIAPEVDWECVVPAHWPYAGRRRTPQQVAHFFTDLSQAEDVQAFEPREFLEAGEHVTVLGWERTTAVETQKTYESQWVQVFTVKEGKITRWRHFFDTAARYGSALEGPPKVSTRNAHPDA